MHEIRRKNYMFYVTCMSRDHPIYKTNRSKNVFFDDVKLRDFSLFFDLKIFVIPSFQAKKRYIYM